MPRDTFVLKYNENYVTRNAPEKFRDFRETGPLELAFLRNENSLFLTGDEMMRHCKPRKRSGHVLFFSFPGFSVKSKESFTNDIFSNLEEEEEES